MRSPVQVALLLAIIMTAPKPNMQSPLSDPSSVQTQRLHFLEAERTSLQERIGNLDADQDRWHDWYARATKAAGILTFVTAVSGLMAIFSAQKESRKSRQLKPLNAQLNQTIESIADLYRSDALIGIAKSSSLASVAEGHTEELRQANIRLRADLGKEVADAQTRTEELRRQNDDVEKSLEEEKVKRVKLAASLLPRDFFDQSGAVGELSSLRPMCVAFVYGNETEPREMAEQIAFVLKEVNWTFFRFWYEDASIRPGITISPGLKHAGIEPMIFSAQIREGQETAQHLAGVLTNSDIEAKAGPVTSAFQVPPTTLVIEIGAKPNREAEEAL